MLLFAARWDWLSGGNAKKSRPLGRRLMKRFLNVAIHHPRPMSHDDDAGISEKRST